MLELVNHSLSLSGVILLSQSLLVSLNLDKVVILGDLDTNLDDSDLFTLSQVH